MVPPKSSTTRSPRAMRRRSGSWWGAAPCGPEATMVNAAASCPSSTSKSFSIPATSSSVLPSSPTLVMRAKTRSAACAARRSRSISASSLISRRGRSTSVAVTRRFQGRHQQGALARGRQQEGGEPVALLHAQPREVGQVGRGGHEQPVQALSAHRLLGARHAAAVIHCHLLIVTLHYVQKEESCWDTWLRNVKA